MNDDRGVYDRCVPATSRFSDGGQDGYPLGRRAFLGLIGAVASSVLWGSAAASFVSRELGGVSSLLPAGLRSA